MVSENDERIDRAAIRLRDGAIYSLPKPATHSDIVFHVINLGFSMSVVNLAEQGYVTDRERFVSKQDAMKIAKEASQLLGEPKRPYHGLFCQDIW